MTPSRTLGLHRRVSVSRKTTEKNGFSSLLHEDLQNPFRLDYRYLLMDSRLSPCISVRRAAVLIILLSLWFIVSLVYTSCRIHGHSHHSFYLKKSVLRAHEEHSDRIEYDCLPLKSWQETSFPTCNALHEIDMSTPAVFLEDASFVAHGFIRDVWRIPNLSYALKTLRWNLDFNLDNWGGQNFDALVSERLTSSSFVANIYGYCGFSALYDYSQFGNLQDHISSLGMKDRLRIAVEISSALADLHSIDDPVLATVVHADIGSRQFIKDNKGNSFLLTDFNTASPLYYRYNPTRSRPIAKEQCPYYMQKAKGKYRAPEEMLHNDDDGGNPVSEKIDVYSLGNILYELLTGERKYLDLEKDEAQVLIINGHVPPNILSFLIPDITNDSIEYRINHALSKAILICFERDPTKRATAKQVYDLLLNEWRQLI